MRELGAKRPRGTRKASLSGVLRPTVKDEPVRVLLVWDRKPPRKEEAPIRAARHARLGDEHPHAHCEHSLGQGDLRDRVNHVARDRDRNRPVRLGKAKFLGVRQNPSERRGHPTNGVTRPNPRWERHAGYVHRLRSGGGARKRVPDMQRGELQFGQRVHHALLAASESLEGTQAAQGQKGLGQSPERRNLSRGN